MRDVIYGDSSGGIVMIAVLTLSLTFIFVVVWKHTDAEKKMPSMTGHIPGPLVARFTGFWFTYKGYMNQQNEYIRQLHLEYGPVVCVSPGVISFNSVEAINPIYGVRSKLGKPADAVNMDNYNCSNTFSSVSNEDHRRRRGRYGAVYNKTNMTTGEVWEAICQRTATVLDKVSSTAVTRQPVDVYRLFHFYSIDVVALVTTGVSTGLLDGHSLQFSNDLRIMFSGLGYVYYFGMMGFWLRYSPGWLHFLVPDEVKQSMAAHDNVEKFNLAHYERAKRSNTTKEVKGNVMDRLLQHKDFGGEDLSDMHVASEISDHLLAGADTLVASVVYILWELAKSRNINYLTRLQRELDNVSFDARGTPINAKEIEGLPVLDAVIKEGLRVHAPSGHIQARQVIVDQSTSSVVIAGATINRNFEVGIPLYTILLHPEIYDNALQFHPERWDTPQETIDQAKLQQMNQAWMPFGRGSRACVGKELAMVEARLLLACLLHRMNVELDNDQDQEEMVGVQAAVLAPKGGRCMLRFSLRVATEIDNKH